MRERYERDMRERYERERARTVGALHEDPMKDRKKAIALRG